MKQVLNSFYLVVGIFLYSFALQGKVLIITHAYNRPDFIEIQEKTFKKFLSDDYEFVVFNDAPGKDMKRAIRSTCKKLGIKCIRIPQAIHKAPYLPKRADESGNNPCKRCAHVVQYSLDILGFKHDDLVAIIDSDMFLIKPFSIRGYMENIELAGVPQYRTNGSFMVEYLWNGILFFDMRTLPDKKKINFNCGYVEGAATDVGGYTYYYLKEHPSVIRKEIDGLHLCNDYCEPCHLSRQEFLCEPCQNFDGACSHNREQLERYFFTPQMIWLVTQGLDRIEFFLNGSFLHYRSGTNWDNRSLQYHQQKTKILQKFITTIM